MVFLIYLILGYWAVGQTVYANKIVIYSGTAFYCKKIAIAFLIGWILIPIAILKCIF